MLQNGLFCTRQLTNAERAGDAPYYGGSARFAQVEGRSLYVSGRGVAGFPTLDAI
jgi:hypothetical protein